MPFYINPMFPNQNIEYPNVNSMQNYDIRELEKKVNNLEKEINNLKNRLNRLENNKYDNYSSNYNANSYNMM